jgi:PhoH-like ATPase
MATTSFTGVKVTQISSEVINLLYKNKTLDLGKEEYPNQFIVFKSEGSQSALARVDGTGKAANLISDKLTASGIKAKNKEQAMALDMLLDDTVPVNVMTGKAGSGKTICALAVALAKFEAGKYKKIIVTRPMSQVGSYELGILPGTVSERFSPYLGNFYDNLIQLAGKNLEDILEQFNIECLPIQLMRGRSLMDTFIICDEVQVLDFNEMRTLGTRVGENSKIVIMGDMQQRDSKISKTNTGLYKLMNSEISKESALVASIELLKVERSKTSALFGDIFEEK